MEPWRVIEAGRSEKQYWRDLWQYRELFYFLSWRDILVRYKQTAIGIAWAIIRPFLTMIVFTVIFSHLANLPTQGTAPYPIFGIISAFALAIFRKFAGSNQQQLGEQCELDLENILSSIDCSSECDRRKFR